MQYYEHIRIEYQTFATFRIPKIRAVTHLFGVKGSSPESWKIRSSTFEPSPVVGQLLLAVHCNPP